MIGESQKYQKVSNTGWSVYFFLNILSAIILASMLYFLKSPEHPPHTSFLIAIYLFADKFFRSYISNARIHLKYGEIGIAEMINGAISLCLVIMWLPQYGIPGIFLAFIVSHSFA